MQLLENLVFVGLPRFLFPPLKSRSRDVGCAPLYHQQNIHTHTCDGTGRSVGTLSREVTLLCYFLPKTTVSANASYLMYAYDLRFHFIRRSLQCFLADDFGNSDISDVISF